MLMTFSDWQVFDEEGRRKYVNRREVSRFLAVADTLVPTIRALCYVLCFSGCRVSEALNLTRDHLDPDRGTITFRTLKRRKLCFRTVPVPIPLLKMLLALPRRKDARLFPMHRATAWRNIKHVMTLAGISGPMASPKGLRHGFGMRCADKSIPPNLLQRWMGHANVNTTSIYQQAVGEEERRFARRLWKN